MASEVVCGLVFRLLLPICLAVGESGLLAEVTRGGNAGSCVGVVVKLRTLAL
jgi:hypothetical protein